MPEICSGYCWQYEVGVIQRRNGSEVRDHDNSVAGRRIKLADAEAMNFSLMEMFVLRLMVASLVHFCTTATAGDIFAVFRYVLMFIIGLDSVPRLVHQLSRLRHIGMRRRLSHQLSASKVRFRVEC